MELCMRLCLGLGTQRLPSPPCWALGSFGLFSHTETEQSLKWEYFLKNPIFSHPAHYNCSSLLAKTVQIHVVKKVSSFR